jgi:hypothetical protein
VIGRVGHIFRCTLNRAFSDDLLINGPMPNIHSKKDNLTVQSILLKKNMVLVLVSSFFALNVNGTSFKVFRFLL